VIRIHQIAHTRSRIRNSVNRLGKESLVFGGCPDLIVSSQGCVCAIEMSEHRVLLT
jgi:hypothetical protein